MLTRLEHVPAENATLKAKADTASNTSSTTTRPLIEQIPRPQGEAGDRHYGFVLHEAMHLDLDDPTEDCLYKGIHVSLSLSIFAFPSYLPSCHAHDSHTM